jgi:hypothetical protein
MRAAKFERLTWAVPDTAVAVADSGPASTRPGDPGIVAFGIALELWDGLRDAVAAITARARHARTGRRGP